MKTRLLILFLSGNALAAPEGEIYKCTTNGQTIITNTPCNGKNPKPIKEKHPDYAEIVHCGMISGVENLARVLIDQPQKQFDCGNIKK